VHATEVGGTHPALIEAMGAGNCALTLNTPENVEVLGDAGILYDSVDDLTQQLQRVLADPALITEYRRRAMARVLKLYNWEQITDEYETLLSKLADIEIANPVAQAASSRPEFTYPLGPFVEEKPTETRRTATTLH
jgi:hypothetical protein